MSRGKKQQPIPLDRTRAKPTEKGTWDLLEEVFEAMVPYATTVTNVDVLVKNPEVIQQVADADLLTKRVKCLVDDVTVFGQELLKIHSSHQDRRGDATDPDDNMRSIEIFGQYTDWAEKFESTVYPVYIAINEQIGHAVGIDVMNTLPTELAILKPTGEIE